MCVRDGARDRGAALGKPIPFSAKDANHPKQKPPIQNLIKNSQSLQEVGGTGAGGGRTDRQRGAEGWGERQASHVGEAGFGMQRRCEEMRSQLM